MSEFFRALERAERERALRQTPNGHGTRAGAPSEGEDSRPHGTPAPSESPGTRAHATPGPVESPPAPVVATPRPVPSSNGKPAPAVAAPSAGAGARRYGTPAPPEAPAAVAADSRPLSSVLGTRMRRSPGEVDEHLVSLITPDTFEADQYRVLRHTVEQRRRSSGLGIVAVSSAGPGDGKTTTAINLAGALAQDRGGRVLLVDCDLRSSAMATRLGLTEGRGLVQAIVDPVLTLDDAIRHLSRFNLDVMPAGFETASPYELLKSPRLGELFEAARRRYDYVVVDTPPAVPFPDCRVLAKVVDGFLLVVTAHRTPRRLVEDALGVLPKEALVGLVFNGEAPRLSGSYDGYYGGNGRANGRTWRRGWRRGKEGAA